jgi:predicted ABC-class ATPase
MIRDGRMQRLVPRPGEPIVPFLDRVRELYDGFGVSTILVTGGSGDYLEVADTVIRMDAYQPRDVTQQAREVARSTHSMRLREDLPPLKPPTAREPRMASGFRPHALRSSSRGPRGVRIGDETVSLRALDQLVEAGQVRAIGRLMRGAAIRMANGKSMSALIDEIEARLDADGLDALDPPVAYDLARPRRFELAAALNRWRAMLVARPGTAR